MKYVEKPWGHELWLAVNDKYAMKKLTVFAGHSLSLQYHEEKMETMYCVGGEGHLELNEVKIPMVPGVVMTIYPKDVHRLSAVEDLTIIECSTPELDDVVRLEDNYNRTTKR
jgi:mannose-6-phosphate isomerase-like protein (cupin superfamily)